MMETEVCCQSSSVVRGRWVAALEA